MFNGKIRLFHKTVGVLTLVLLFFNPLLYAAADKKTPSHVYQLTEQIVREIQLIRDFREVREKGREPGLQFNKLPLHVFAKSLEIKSKLLRIEQELGLSTNPVDFVPVKKISAADVYQSMLEIVQELHQLKEHWKIQRKIEAPIFVAGKNPSDVYENAWRASYLLDGLVGAITPSDVFRNALYVQQDLKQINQVMKVSIPQTMPEDRAERTIGPKDVLIESFKNLYRVSSFERKIGIPPFIPPEFPHGKITPSQPYDVLSMLLAELARVKLHLRINSIPKVVDLPEGKTPGDVLTQIHFIGKNLESLAQ